MAFGWEEETKKRLFFLNRLEELIWVLDKEAYYFISYRLQGKKVTN